MSATVTLRAANITAVYRSASIDQLAFGREWYAQAHALACELDPTDPDRAAAVIAVLSPSTPWPRNVALARMAYERHRRGVDVAGTPGTVSSLRTLGRNARKAAAILAGGDPVEHVQGPKVIKFWHAIARPDLGSSVVVDRHAFDVAAGRVTDDATRGAHLGRVGGSESVQRLYVQAARILSRQFGQEITPTEVQAVTWIVWRESAIRTAAAMRRERTAA